jgi:hypothetical protein
MVHSLVVTVSGEGTREIVVPREKRENGRVFILGTFLDLRKKGYGWDWMLITENDMKK